jgi:hypothetical protein
MTLHLIFPFFYFYLLIILAGDSAVFYIILKKLIFLTIDSQCFIDFSIKNSIFTFEKIIMQKI